MADADRVPPSRSLDNISEDQIVGIMWWLAKHADSDVTRLRAARSLAGLKGMLSGKRRPGPQKKSQEDMQKELERIIEEDRKNGGRGWS
jgi:hypothetical protein